MKSTATSERVGSCGSVAGPMGRRITGGVKRLRDRWWARVVLHREPKDAGGRYRQRLEAISRPGEEMSEADALNRARRLQERYDAGTWHPPTAKPEAAVSGQVSVAVWVDTWLSRQEYREAAKDRARVAAWLPRTALATLAIEAVTPRDVARFVSDLRSLSSPRTKAKPAPRTVRNVCDAVARAMRGAVFDDLLKQDPWAVLPTQARPQSVDARPERRREMRLARRELETLLGEPSVEARWSVLWHILALTGARLGEAIALRWSDVVADQPLSRVYLGEQVHHRTRERIATKTGAVREVPLHPWLAEVLERWRADGWPREYGRKPAAGDLVVPCRAQPGRPWGAADGTGGPLWAQDVYRALQRDLEACGIRPHRVHDLRHTFVSLCADAGMAADVVTRWTHTPAAGTTARALYLVPAWERQCAEMLRLQGAARTSRGPIGGTVGGTPKDEGPGTSTIPGPYSSARRGT